jgi:hypothetical protein
LNKSAVQNASARTARFVVLDSWAWMALMMSESAGDEVQGLIQLFR